MLATTGTNETAQIATKKIAEARTAAEASAATPVFDYDTAFCRNIGIISVAEQKRLRDCCVALAGVGGVGSFYAHAMARMGVGRFVIADGDTYSLANFNRQMGGNMDTVGVNKAQAVAQQILRINPTAEVKLFGYLNERNVDDYLESADLVLDAVEMFHVEDNRMLFRAARRHGLPVLMAAPFGFSTVFVMIDPCGMSAEEYFDWNDAQTYEEKMARFALGLAPSFLQIKELGLGAVDLEKHTGPSHVGACLLCAGVIASETTRLLLKRQGGRFAPQYLQFNPYEFRFICGRIRGGNRNWRQKLRLWTILRRWRKLHPVSIQQMGKALV